MSRVEQQGKGVLPGEGVRGEVIGHDLVRHGSPQRKSSEVIHRASCSVMAGRKVVPWNWAEGRPVSEWMSLGWFKACQRCRPDLGS